MQTESKAFTLWALDPLPEPNNIRPFIVSRESWGRGQGSLGYSFLLRRDDHLRCCLGFVGAQCEIPDSDLLIITYPCNIYNEHERQKYPEWMLKFSTIQQTDVYKCAAINDSSELKDSYREYYIRTIFRANGSEVFFVDTDQQMNNILQQIN